MKLFEYQLAVILVIFLSGCATTPADSKVAPPFSTDTIHYSTQAVIGACPSVQEEAAAATALGASLIATGINRISAAIKAAGSAKTSVALVRRNIEISKVYPYTACLLVARGWFHNQNSRQNKSLPYKIMENSNFKYESRRSHIRRQGLFIAGTPDFFFEGRIKASSNSTHSTVAPVYAYLDTPLASNVFRQNSKRQVMVSFAVNDGGGKTDFGKGQGSTIVIGELESGTGKTYPEFDELLETRTCIKKCTENSEFTQLMRSIYESDWFSLSLKDKPVPMTLEVLVSETQNKSEFLTFVAEVFSGAQETITQEAQQSLISSIGKSVSDAEAAAQVSAKIAFDKAFGDTYTKLTACLAKPTDIGVIAAAKSSMRALNLAASGVPSSVEQPFTETDIDSLVLTGGTNALGACAAALAKL